MNDSVSKSLIARRLNEILESVVGDVIPASPSTSPASVVAATSSATITSMPDCFDYGQSLKRLGNDQELFRALARCFVEDADALLSEIATGYHRGEAARVEHAAHSLKGLAATFSAAAVVSRAQIIEQCGRHADLSQVRTVLPELMDETEKLKTALLPYASKDAHGAS